MNFVSKQTIGAEKSVCCINMPSLNSFQLSNNSIWDLHMVHLRTKFEVHLTLEYWVIMFISQKHHLHTYRYTLHHDGHDSFSFEQEIKQKTWFVFLTDVSAYQPLSDYSTEDMLNNSFMVSYMSVPVEDYIWAVLIKHRKHVQEMFLPGDIRQTFSAWVSKRLDHWYSRSCS